MLKDQQHSPPRGASGLGRSSSIFSYQTRLLSRNNNITSPPNGRQTPTNSSSITASPAYASLASIAGKEALADSPPSTPIRRAVAKMIVDSSPSPTSTPTARTVTKHVRAAKSVDSVRNQWEAKIAGAQDGGTTHIMQKGGRGISATSRTAPMPSIAALPPPSSLPSTEPTEQAATQVEVSPTQISTDVGSEKDGSSRSSSSYMARRVAKRSTVYGASEFDSIRIPSTASMASTSTNLVDRPASPSIASTGSLLSPNATGESLAPSVRGQSVEERLAIAKSNALKRRQAREQAKAAVTHTQPATQSVIEKGTTSGQQEVMVDSELGITKKMPSQDKVTNGDLFQSEMANGKVEVNTSVIKPISDLAGAKQSSPSIPLASKVAASPFHDLFTPSSRQIEPTIRAPSTASDSNPLYSRSSLRSIVTPPSASASTSRYVPSGLSSFAPSASPTEPPAPSNGGGKYGSISRTDRRRLGRHLPRIASGEKGWEDDEASKGKDNASEGRRVPSTLGKHTTILADSEEENKPPRPKIGKKMDEHVSTNSTPKSSIVRATQPPDILAPSVNENQPQPQASRIPSTPSKRRSQFMPFTHKSAITDAINPKSPRPELTGEEMKGLMNAVGSLPARGGQKDEDDGVTGMSNRLRLTKSRLPPSASSASVAPAPLPSKRLIQTNWMDKHRHALGSYEYLCHVGEAQQWIEGCLEEELPFGVTEMEEGLKNGVVLAKLARVYEGEEVVKKIWTETKHRYKQSDNINYFLNFVRNVGMPETFIFELTDLYNKKNIPKVIFCIHVLSHLLARLGRAERIGNLVGQFEFTNEQIAAAQKDLQGIAMPNFGDAGKSLAKEASWVPEEPEETEDEKRDRLLQECEDSIIGLQRHLRGHLARMRSSRIQAQLELAEPIIRRLQARARGVLCRRALLAELKKRKHLHSMAQSIQAAVRGQIVRRSWEKRVTEVRSLDVVGLQAHLKGLLARTKRKTDEKRLGNTMKGVTGLQAHCRGCLMRRGRRTYKNLLEEPQTVQSISSLQALLRGRLHRQTVATQQRKIVSQTATFTSLQSHLRGAIVRRNIRAQEQKMDDATNYIVAVQAVARGVLARNKKRTFTRELQQSASSTISFQALARARIAKQSHKSMQKALAKVEVAGSVGGLQAFLRTKLAKKQTTEQKKKLEFVQPDVIGFQAMARGYLAREEYHFWRDYLHDGKTIGALVFLQSLMRGFIARRRHYIRTSFIHQNVDKIVKIQALWRGRQQRVSYEKLITGIDVDVPTIQSYMHLLDDTESDFADQVRIEALRGQVVDLIRENQTLETEVKDLDTKIALIINNQMTFQELARAKRRTETATYHAPNNDPFSNGVHLDRTNQRKLELYEQLFFMLQTKPEYISRLLRVLSIEDETAEKERRLVEGVTMILFAFGHERREEYLFHKLLQLAVHEEILRAPTLQDLVHSRFPIIPVTAQYIKPSLTPYIHDVIAPHVMRIVGAPELDLCTDPVRLYIGTINAEETQTGMPSALPRDRNADQILQEHAITRALFIRNLQELRNLTDFLLTDILQSHDKLPYTIRLMAREALLALQRKFPEAMDDDLVPVVARTVILPFLLPAIIAPEQFGMAPDGVGAVERRNLSELANLLTHVAGQAYTDTPDQRLMRTPLEAFITAMALPFREWLLDVADVEHAEGHFHAHELFESTIEAKPIKITRKDIYGMLSALIQHVDVLTHGSKKDPIVPILEELEGPPIDYDKSKNQVNLRLTNRLAGPTPGDPKAGAKADWIQAKRHVLAVLRVQTGKTLFDVLVSRPEDIHEQLWIQEVHRDIALENARKARHGLPPAPVEAEYQIESIRSLPFHEVKSRAIEFCMKLERSGRLSREDNLQGLLVSIASDIRQKHHLRKLRKDNLAGMIKAHEDMSKKKEEFEGRVKAYHDYIDGAMAELQAKGKKKPLFMSKQYRHQMSQKKQGKQAKFGSYKYTAADLYGKRILLSVNQFSPRQFDKLFIVISSNEVGVFNLELSYPSSTTVPGGLLGQDEVRMEDLLGAQYENKERLDMFEGQAAFSLNMLIHQINKKFYHS
ncbi:IQ domain-containing protein containing GTPase activating protein [Cryptococcus neoformans C23]|uniref:IQ domain-containing GTPase activating protein n=1 Tax=Cryptococcus neoformans (strain H99 / ATCC 208821 / CBS 10515 / FGSC 9487) TaxID=235443 RepID=J9VKY0_CRYN9|nr:IQ domain-containing GTPase activating protein [Cryptococcus neoformans var. grubii H99]AUB22787.1 IQ domain-containing GTPase activating protein [Cryptococcus neoformans var. grubii]OWZ35491.1 IQ domain-containing protein containing GTPase activating protein [Cryptococcus neoformans var. grubii AD2-60a]OWZ47370.1 IQ domain-containing protein containing GTPase activating protein [Cryptococcus neoformans var. grubii C23]OXC86575.1 IQ domain-containing protein containing GTPase activating prot|eukprot:XP_012047212.1 IQ domain-containing GTPase activating protein [Cryptococcus neoformans var. grubii H99]